MLRRVRYGITNLGAMGVRCTKTFNDYNVKKIWEEGENFGFLKTFIEFRDNNANMGENSNANTGIGKNNDANVG